MTPLTPAIEPLQPPGRAIDDPSAVRQAIFDRALKTVTALPPISDQLNTLRFESPHYADPDKISLAKQKQAILAGNSVARRLRATAVVTDNATGSELGRRQILLANVPYFTNRATFINNGTEYTLSHQFRLKPGIYTREKDNGELEAHVNVMPGEGVPHRLFLDPKTGVFRAKINQAQIPLVPLLRSLGVTDDQLKEAWGSQLATINTHKTSAGDLAKLYQRLVPGGKTSDPDTMQKAIAEALLKTRLDPEVSQKTLGKPFKDLSGEVVLAATRKLLAVRNRNNKELLNSLNLEPAEQDDRDHLAYMRLLGPEDLIAERLKAAAAQYKQQLWRVGRRGIDALQTGVLDSGVREALLHSGLGQVSEQINPAQVYDQQVRVSRMGLGGIPSLDAIPESSQSVQPSQAGFVDPVTTPESERAGVDSRLIRNVRKGENGEIYAQFLDKEGKKVWRQPKELFDAVIAFPGQDRTPQADGRPAWIKAIRKGKLEYTPAGAEDYSFDHYENAFSPAANLVAGKSQMKGQRVAMAARMATQSLPLLRGETPLVQTALPEDPSKSFEEVFGERMGAVRAQQGGRVLAVGPDAVTVQYADGRKDEIELAQNLPGNRKTGLHQTPTVQVGQEFQPGALLARSNYTDANGNVALGVNARTGWLPFKGYNFEDAIVISRGLADRMRSDHLYQHGADAPLSKRRFLGIFADRFSREQLDRLDDDGIIQPGQTVRYGDPLVLGARQREGRIGEVSRAGSSAWSEQSDTWDHHSDGVVTDVVRRKDGGVTVAVKTERAFQVGDKISGRHGNKGVVSYIANDDEMPTGADGQPLELLYNPHGVISRANPSQAAEAAFGKLAAKLGKPYLMKDFDGTTDMRALAEEELKKHGMSSHETLRDPESGFDIPDVLTGNTFVMKLHHVSEDKGSGRGFGGYTADSAPAKGGPEGAKTWGVLHLNALLSHGATGAIRDAHLVRGQANPKWWSDTMAGRTPPDPEPPPAYRKFIAHLQGMGINPIRRGTKTHLMAMTPKAIEQAAGNRVLQNASTVDWNDANMKPVRGGLFDETLFGGAQGDRFAKLPLAEPMLNPVMQDPARRLLGLTNQGLMDVLSGKTELNGKRGPEALFRALEAIDVDKEILRAEAEMKSGRKGKREDAIRRLGPLQGAKKTGIHPKEWMWTDAPVLPPKWRPISKMAGTDTPLVADPNYLYRDLFEANQNLQAMAARGVDVSDERTALYNSLKAVAGLGDPVSPKLQEQGVKGILKYITGSSPKYGIVQRRLLGTTTDLVGRATIIPNPDLDMDEVGLPEEKAWKVYEPFIVQHMVRRGMSSVRAVTAVSQKEQSARDALLAVMKERPVFIDRAPVLHRYGVMAFWPRLTRGTNLETSPVVIKGFGGDYDGDAMQYHVPGTDDAVRDAVEKMMPSKNLFSVADFQPNWVPSQEYLAGLHTGSTRKSDARPITFADKSSALRAIRAGQVHPFQPIEILKDK